MKIFAFAASLRGGSFNRKLVELAASRLRAAEVDVDLAEFAEFRMPLYDGDLEKQEGLPTGAVAMIERIRRADAVVIASPEYNYSLPGTLKNAIDWISRDKSGPLRGKPTLLLAASTSAVGGIRGLWQLRIPLEGAGMFVYPDMFALASAQKAFDDNGKLLDETLGNRLNSLLVTFTGTANKLIA